MPNSRDFYDWEDMWEEVQQALEDEIRYSTKELPPPLPKECGCGTSATYKDPKPWHHSKYCDLYEPKEEDE